ncbi:hypothetical protein [Pseudomonas silensiensis]|uniref:hypothetical protein n=1 Tax=Pseudomonas silensiensis TaxID=2991049 RepID=UPI003D1D741A
MDDYRNHPHAKLFYRPIEIAVRCCQLMPFETRILQETEYSILFEGKLKQWPCLRHRIELLRDAIRHKELPYGYMGVTVTTGEIVEPPFLTIRHAHLKNWFVQYYPTEKPDFLFGQFERQAISPHTLDVYKTLLVELGMYKAEREQAQKSILELTKERNSLRHENAKLLIRMRNAGKPSERSERAYLRLIEAFIRLLLGKTPSGVHYSSFTSQASIISVLMANNRGKPGFTQRTLEEKFAAAKRSTDSSD